MIIKHYNYSMFFKKELHMSLEKLLEQYYLNYACLDYDDLDHSQRRKIAVEIIRDIESYDWYDIFFSGNSDRTNIVLLLESVINDGLSHAEAIYGLYEMIASSRKHEINQILRDVSSDYWRVNNG